MALDELLPVHRDVCIFGTLADFEEHAAKEIAQTVADAIRVRGICFLVLSGGETPKGVYRRLGSDPLKGLIDWDKVHVFFSDERCVPPTDPKSNYGMVERELFSHVDLRRENIHRMIGEIDAGESARQYAQMLHDVFAGQELKFDLVVLGIGEDGHTASLFPATDVVHDYQSLVREVFVPKLNSWRVTLTFRSINTARQVAFLAAGRHKAAIVKRVLQSADLTGELPASLVQPKEGRVRWLLDRDAAGELIEDNGSRSKT